MINNITASLITKRSIDKKFRTDINGLRAWAVVAVIFYHFGVPGFSGGFVGVDIFFVISGFLMTGIIVSGLEKDKFSFIDFYLGRVRRIVPALAFLCAILLSLGWFVLLPLDYKVLSTHVIASIGFISNFKYLNEAGYFDLASHEKWLLHTWSLSVEWQFYLVLPILIWCIWKLSPIRNSVRNALLISLVISFATSLLITSSRQSEAFYLLHTRAWELLAGGGVFLYAKTLDLSIRSRRWFEFLGFILIIFSIKVFSSDFSWPSGWAIFPVVATCLILFGNCSSFWSGSAAVQWLGDRSYSLYLWHWPVYVALVYLELQANGIAICFGIFLTICLGHFSFLYIENPSRQALEKIDFYKWVGFISLLSCVIAVSILIRSNEGITGRFVPEVELAAAEGLNFNPRRSECHPGKGSISPSCVFGGNSWKVIVVGDSHVPAVISGLAAAQKYGEAGAVEWSYSGCLFLPGMKILPVTLAELGDGYRCVDFIQWVLNELNNIPKNIPIVIIGRYAQSAFGFNEFDKQSKHPRVFFSKIYDETTPEYLAEFSEHIVKSACALAENRTVFMMRPIPEMRVDIPKTVSRRMAWGSKLDVTISIEEYRSRNSWVWRAQDEARDKCGIKILDPIPYLCDLNQCFGSKEGKPLYYDDDHLSEYGNKLLKPMFSQIF